MGITPRGGWPAGAYAAHAQVLGSPSNKTIILFYLTSLLCSALDARLPEADPPLTLQSSAQQVHSPLICFSRARDHAAAAGEARLHEHAAACSPGQAGGAAARLCGAVLGGVSGSAGRL